MATNPVLSCGGHRGRAPECVIPCTVMTKVIFVLDSSWSRREVTVNVPPAVDMITVDVFVRGVDSAVLAPVSSDVDKFVPNATVSIRDYKKIGVGKGRANVIPKIHYRSWEVTGSSPVSGYVPDGLHTGQWQAIAVPLRCILVDWHVVQIERFVHEPVVVLQRVGLDQSPCEIELGIKVAVDLK